MYHRFFRRHVCLSNFKTRVIRELPLTAHKTIFSHLKKLKETTRFRLIHFVHNLMIRCSKKEWQKIIQENAFEQKKEERKKNLISKKQLLVRTQLGRAWPFNVWVRGKWQGILLLFGKWFAPAPRKLSQRYLNDTVVCTILAGKAGWNLRTF